MSLILDALKKAEQDRHVGQPPVLDEMLVRRDPAPSRRRDRQQDVALLAAVGAALLFAAAGAVYWLWPARAPEPAVAATPAAATADSELSAPALRVDPERLQAPVTDLPEAAIDLSDTGAAEAMTMDDLEGEAPPPQASRPAPAAASPSPAATGEAPPVAPPPATAPPAPPVEASVRALKDMPPAFRSEFPRLGLDIHVYDDNPLRRFVLINGKKYRESDTLLDGPRVVEITPEGVIVEQRGSKVLLELPR